MHLRPRRQVTTAGLAIIAVALAACSSSSPTTTATGTSTGTASAAASGAKLSGTLNGSGSSFQLIFQQTAIQNFKTVQPNMTVNYGGGGSGKGRTDLSSGVTN